MHEIRILDAAARELEQINKPAGRRIVARIRWLAENLDDIKPEALAGNLSGLYKLRAGDYRIFYEVRQAEQTIVIHKIGHRREIYRRR